VLLLRERSGLVEGRTVNDLTLQREAGLLLAYLSYQRDNTESVREGLAVASSTLSEEEVENRDMDERLISYLTELWTPAQEADPEPEPAEVEPEPEPDVEPEPVPESGSAGG